jgi:hypothetical protein
MTILPKRLRWLRNSEGQAIRKSRGPGVDGLFKYDPIVDGGLDRLGAAWDWTGPGVVRGAKNFGDQFLTKIRQWLGAQASTDDLTNANNNGGSGGPTATAVVTPPMPLMTPEGPIPVGPSVAIPGSPGYVPPTATVSSNSSNDDASDSTGAAPPNLTPPGAGRSLSSTIFGMLVIKNELETTLCNASNWMRDLLGVHL